MQQTCVPCSNKAKTLLALQRSTDVQNVNDEAEVDGAEEALFYVCEGGASSFERSATTFLDMQSNKLSHDLTGTAISVLNKTCCNVRLRCTVASCLCAGVGRLTMLSTPWLERQIEKGQTFRNQQEYSAQDAVLMIAVVMMSRPADPSLFIGRRIISNARLAVMW